jgi:hypothetical protein
MVIQKNSRRQQQQNSDQSIEGNLLKNIVWTSLVNPGCGRFTWTLPTKSKCSGKPNSGCHVGLGNFHLPVPGHAKSGQHAKQSTRINEWSMVTTEGYPMPANLSGLLQFLQRKHLHQRVASFFARTHSAVCNTEIYQISTSANQLPENPRRNWSSWTESGCA